MYITVSERVGSDDEKIIEARVGNTCYLKEHTRTSGLCV